MKRIKHNDLTHYFLRPHSELPRAYLASCEKFFNTFHSVDNEKFKRQAASCKPQAPSSKRHEKDIIEYYNEIRKK